MERDPAERTVTELFEIWYPSVVQYANHRCGSLDLAEDLAQEAFMSLCRILQSDTIVVNPKAWLLAAIRNQICKHWRDRGRHSEGAAWHPESEHPAPPDGDSAFGVPGHDLADLLAVLTPREEEAVRWRAKGLKYGEIAALMGVSSNSVGTLLFRAIRKMREEEEKNERNVSQSSGVR